MFTPINPAFYAAVRDTQAYAISQLNLAEADLNSEALSLFPLFILEELGDEVRNDPKATALRERLICAAFASEFRARTEE